MKPFTLAPNESREVELDENTQAFDWTHGPNAKDGEKEVAISFMGNGRWRITNNGKWAIEVVVLRK